MHSLQQTYHGLGLVMELNWDLFLYAATIIVALMAGAWLGSLI
ncbi:hypothetical protein [Antarcticimicrobium luteum]|nr:hypothetical protein [Antarcticimicrobium luteum]